MLNMDIIEVAEMADRMFQTKYEDKFESLKKNFIAFYNLTDQISQLYVSILDATNELQNLDDTQNIEQWQTLRIVLNRSLAILHRISENPHIQLDLAYCDRFIKVFETNLNILCSYYHSLSHIEVISKKVKFEKKKIVQGINKMFRLHSDIKTQFRNNYQQLKNISRFKQFMVGNIKNFAIQSDQLKIKNKVFHNFMDTATEFYHQIGDEEMAEKQEIQPPLHALIKAYFKILHQFYQSQSQLQVHLRPINIFCQELKARKRATTNYGTADAVNNFTKISSQLLKPTISIKNFKKLKLEDYQKALSVILKDLAQNGFIKSNAVGFNIFTNSILNISNQNNIKLGFENVNGNMSKQIQERIEGFIDQILEISNFLMECAKQVEKVQNSGVLNVIQEYKENLTGNNSETGHHHSVHHKKFTIKLGEYQKYMQEYYTLHQEIKQFQRVVQEMMLIEFGLKINISIDLLNDITLTH